jgi:hypothetical protein
MASILKPPMPIAIAPGARSVFLAGSIAMGQAEPWQDIVTAALAHTSLTILNPRRDDWDAAWPQDVAHPGMRGQIEWELEGLERADLVVMYFVPTTLAPITLLELGLLARSGRLVACCPPGFWRRANVDVVCRRYGVPTAPDLPALITAITAALT